MLINRSGLVGFALHSAFLWTDPREQSQFEIRRENEKRIQQTLWLRCGYRCSSSLSVRRDG